MTTAALDCRLLLVSEVDPLPNWSQEAHVHDHHELLIILAGEYHADLRDGEVHAQAGEAVFFPRGLWHRPRFAEAKDLSELVVIFDEPDEQAAARPRQIRDWSGQVFQLAQRLRQIYFNEHPHAPGVLDALVHLLLYEFNQANERRGQGPVERAQQHLRLHLAEPIGLERLAAVAGQSRHHFSRVFKRHTGLSPMRFLQETRLQEARTLLCTTGLPLKSIAERVGICHAYHLSYLLKRRTGLTPRQIRAGARGG